MSSPHITYTPRTDATPETEATALAAVYKFALFDSQAKRGGSHDLTSNPTTEHKAKRPTERIEKEKTQRD